MDLALIRHLDGINRREDFAKLINQMGYEVGLEIGVDEGGFSEVLLENSKLDVLFGLDNWKKYPERRIIAQNRLKRFGERSRLIVGASPTDSPKFTDNSLDFIYIDGDHRYRPVKADIKGFWPKVKSGGCLAGHDYVERKMCGVIHAVDDFLSETPLALYTTKEDGPLPTDQLISWFVFKP